MAASTLRIAWRNLGRNARRTAITGIALAIGTSLSVAAFGLTDGMNAGLLDALTKYDLGHVQIHQRDFPRTHALDKTIDDAPAVLAKARAAADVAGATPRVYNYALISHGTHSMSAELVGVDPRTEPTVTRLDRQVALGTYLPPEPTPWPKGRPLTAEERALDRQLSEATEQDALSEIGDLQPLGGDGSTPTAPTKDVASGQPDGGSAAEAKSDNNDAHTLHERRERARRLALIQAPPPAHALPAFVGSSLATTLHVGVGQEIHATGQAVDGTAEQVELRVVGIFATGTALIDRRIYLDVADLQRFSHLGDRVHEIAISATSPDQAAAIAERLQHELGDPLIVRDWRQIRPDVGRIIDLQEVSTAIMIFIILFVATLGVVNTMLMAVFERTRELGVLKAIGMSGFRIVGLIVAETTLLAIAASALGTGAGLLIDWYMVRYGVDLSSLISGTSFGGLGINSTIYGAITVQGIVLPAVLLAVTSFVASFYPAIRAARLRPAIGMRET